MARDAAPPCRDACAQRRGRHPRSIDVLTRRVLNAWPHSRHTPVRGRCSHHSPCSAIAPAGHVAFRSPPPAARRQPFNPASFSRRAADARRQDIDTAERSRVNHDPNPELSGDLRFEPATQTGHRSRDKLPPRFAPPLVHLPCYREAPAGDPARRPNVARDLLAQLDKIAWRSRAESRDLIIAARRGRGSDELGGFYFRPTGFGPLALPMSARSCPSGSSASGSV